MSLADINEAPEYPAQICGLPIDPQIPKWKRIVDLNLHGPNSRTGAERLATYLCSLSLGRDFLEDTEHYIDRAGYREFYDWAVSYLPCTSRQP